MLKSQPMPAPSGVTAARRDEDGVFITVPVHGVPTEVRLDDVDANALAGQIKGVLPWYYRGGGTRHGG